MTVFLTLATITRADLDRGDRGVETQQTGDGANIMAEAAPLKKNPCGDS